MTFSFQWKQVIIWCDTWMSWNILRMMMGCYCKIIHWCEVKYSSVAHDVPIVGFWCVYCAFWPSLLKILWDSGKYSSVQWNNPDRKWLNTTHVIFHNSQLSKYSCMETSTEDLIESLSWKPPWQEGQGKLGQVMWLKERRFSFDTH